MIEDIIYVTPFDDDRPSDLEGFTQCHFFAGIGVWSYALRQAGVPDDRPIWTGSCPCQPFSTAGAGAGFDDERHLWPHFQWLIEQCRPAVILGEQVASKAADPWIDLVQADMEALGYAFGAVPFPSASVGAPHIRDRLFWVGHTDDEGLEGHTRDDGSAGRERPERSATPTGVFGGLGDSRGESDQRIARSIPGSKTQVGREGVQNGCGSDRSEFTGSGLGGLAYPNGGEQQGQPVIQGLECHRENSGRPQGVGEPESHGVIFRVADADSQRCGDAREGRLPGRETQRAERNSGDSRPGPVNGFWADADWLFCRDGKWRPVEPGTFPLVDGAPARVGRLRAYGNAINAQAAIAFIDAIGIDA